MKIITKRGDGGETDLFGKGRVRKDAPIIDLLGELDELQSFIGWCRCVKNFTGEKIDKQKKMFERGNERHDGGAEFLLKIQDDLYKWMTFVGSGMRWPDGVAAVGEVEVEELEILVEKHAPADLKEFVRPGKNESSARLHIARAVCRRAERRAVAICGESLSSTEKHAQADELKLLIKYLNRLSDALFAISFRENG